MSNTQAFFILSCARSGSTSLATILNEATNGVCRIEPDPKLNNESRLAMEGNLPDMMSVLEHSIFSRVQEHLRNVEVYGEKNLTLGPFVQPIYKRLGCKFVFLKRDGRDVVRSLMNWHRFGFGNIYRECSEVSDLHSRAFDSIRQMLASGDEADFSRPRPLPGELFYKEWEWFSRVQMCAYYWAKVNQIFLEQLSQIPETDWMILDYSSINTEKIMEVAAFCGLKGLISKKVQEKLDGRINSTESRFGVTGSYPHWSDWSEAQRADFEAIAGTIMRELEYTDSDFLKSHSTTSSRLA